MHRRTLPMHYTTTHYHRFVLLRLCTADLDYAFTLHLDADPRHNITLLYLSKTVLYHRSAQLRAALPERDATKLYPRHTIVRFTHAPRHRSLPMPRITYPMPRFGQLYPCTA